MILNTEFEVIYVSPKNKPPAVMQAKLAYEGSSLERWELHAGRHIFLFENNRPELVRKKSTRAVKWRVINSKEFIKQKSQVPDAVVFFSEVWEKMERESAGSKEKTFQDVRNKM